MEQSETYTRFWWYHVAYMWESGAYTRFWLEDLRERDHLGDPGVEGRIMLKWIFRKWDVGCMDWFELAHDRGR
jgi:hypothetical protein